MKTLYFSATGNSLYVAKELGGTLYSIPNLIKQNNFEIRDDEVGIVFPIYELGVPKYIEEFFDKLTIHSSYIFVIMTYGMFAGSAVSHIEKIAKRNNIQISYINKIIMVDNYLPVYKMEEQIKSEHKKQIEKQIQAIKKDVELKRCYIPKDNLKVKVLTSIAKKTRFPKRDKVLGVYKKSFDCALNVEESCVKCGICAKVCPMDNITITDVIKFKGACIGCLSCTHNCPQNSIRVNGEQSRKRYRNTHIDLKEIIKSNNL